MAFNKLTSEEKHVIENKGTERPYTGEYDDFYKEGIYICRRCNNPLFESKAKFDAACGWPAFDAHFKGAVKWLPDVDGQRTEIQCANCGAHLGHVFEGEKMTEKDTRHCVNSLSIKFIPKGQKIPEVLKP
ncbi:peptide-methionine (R)-S-oxide reductase [Candidatus Woesebacteria bacterium RIFCSPHIGHO2_01_FULL_44_21]|uniref:peptide-methionine (R)-S-oxide reductase n=1 Tax=Candidatus Woesebacteria bacterium RIFCSPHIGHO2_01_FULL_44_21 TaxID=1802503 RepID=A0A1F7YV76_9BACT|nr:MAG: peptide-methionine (R)-S-oxide reductase [Candidatus Woesebacteria bacterium RIFCSPHIGHO2_01_FULL_44_21]OGM69564.1 MAG: peptide-methionine (R)-S-oxide reductase [Candidatus Woesebacteria bacterium RIFCSPLOWO2_01_FULL_44_24b]